MCLSPQPQCAGACDILRCFFQREESECQPSSCQHRAEWIKWLCLWSHFVICYLSQPREELGHPFTSAFHRDLSAFSAQSPLLQAPTVTASSYCSFWLSLSIHSAWLWPESVSFSRASEHRSLSPELLPWALVLVVTPTWGMRGWQRTLVVEENLFLQPLLTSWSQKAALAAGKVLLCASSPHFKHASDWKSLQKRKPEPATFNLMRPLKVCAEQQRNILFNLSFDQIQKT